MNKQKYYEPIAIGWAEVLISFDAGEVRQYSPDKAQGIRQAISRNIKYKFPEMEFRTWYDKVDGQRLLFVKRMKDNSLQNAALN